MNFDFTEDQRAIRDAVAAFAAREIAPHAADWDRDHTFPVGVFKALGEIGIMGMSVSEKYGGAQLDAVSVALSIEELSRADAGVGVTVSVHAGLITRIIEQFASEAMRTEYLPKMCAGEWLRASPAA